MVAAAAEEQEEAAAMEEEIRDLTPLPEMTGGAAVAEVQSTATVEQGQQAEVLEKVETRTTAQLVTEGWGWRPRPVR